MNWRCSNENYSGQLTNLEAATCEIISRGSAGEVLAPPDLPPELARLSRKWTKLTYDEKIADAKKLPLQDRLRLLTEVGTICKNAIEVVRDFRPLIEACRDELSHPGHRVEVEGKFTWTEFVPSVFGFSARRMQQLLADGTEESAPAPPPARTKEAKVAVLPRRQEQAARLSDLAIRLAKRLIENKLGDQFPRSSRNSYHCQTGLKDTVFGLAGKRALLLLSPGRAR
jgi:hypothetical protein